MGTLHAIECDDLDTVVERLLSEHYVHSRFSDSLSQRVMDLLLEDLDPGKLIFASDDIDHLKHEYGNDLDLWLFARRCEFLDEIRNLYYQRTEARLPDARQAMESDHDFSIDEKFLRQKHREFLCETDQFTERWRKQVKHQTLQMRLTGLDDEAIRSKLSGHYDRELTDPDRLSELSLRHRLLKAIAKALDPHTTYYPPENADDLNIALGEAFFGIGATIEARNESFFIVKLNPGGPAFHGKQLQLGDQILAVTGPAGEPIEAFGKTITELVHLIRGPKGTRVELTIHRQQNDRSIVKKVPIIRDRIDPVAAAAKASIYLADDTSPQTSAVRVGVISLSSFYLDRAAQRRRDLNYRSASKDVKQLILQLSEQGIDSLILDLRGNGGGILDEAINLTGLFIKEGPVVQKQHAYGDVLVLDDRNPEVSYDGPLTVIVEPDSASASEIVAGALQDYKRALIIGTGKTFGKGTVQIVANVDRDRPELGRYKVTNALYFLPSGRTPQLNGISPDLLIKIPAHGDRTMRDYPYPVPSSSLTSVPYTATHAGSHHLVTLKSRSRSRLGKKPITKSTQTADPRWVSLQQTETSRILEPINEDKSDPVLDECLRIAFDRHQLETGHPLTYSKTSISRISHPTSVSLGTSHR